MTTPPEPTATADELTDDVVVLVDEAGTAIGTAPRATVHTNDTPLHLAFSTFLFGPDGRLLMTRRALTKVAWPGVWTNSACGHRRPQETAIDAAMRRLVDELGTAPSDLKVVLPDFRYRAADASGIVENEFCPVMVGRIDPEALVPNPEEIAELTWMPWETVLQIAETAPNLISPWAVSEITEINRLGIHPLHLLDA